MTVLLRLLGQDCSTREELLSSNETSLLANFLVLVKLVSHELLLYFGPTLHDELYDFNHSLGLLMSLHLSGNEP